jgi:hypothetical protein
MWILVVILALMIPLIAVVLDSPVVRALAGRLEREGQRDSADPQLGSRVAALESEVERLNHELERTREESQFVRNLLEKKPDGGLLPPGDSKD